MNCQLCQKELIAYHEGRLPDGMKTLVKAHIEKCIDCAESYQNLLIAEKVFTEEKVTEPNPFLATRIMAGIEIIDSESMKDATLPVYQKVLKPAIITISLAAAILAGVYMGNRYNPVHNQKRIPVEMAYMNDAELESVNLFSNE